MRYDRLFLLIKCVLTTIPTLLTIFLTLTLFRNLIKTASSFLSMTTVNSVILKLHHRSTLTTPCNNGKNIKIFQQIEYLICFQKFQLIFCVPEKAIGTIDISSLTI